MFSYRGRFLEGSLSEYRRYGRVVQSPCADGRDADTKRNEFGVESENPVKIYSGK